LHEEKRHPFMGNWAPTKT